MELKTYGLIIKKRDFQDNVKFLTILTPNNGVMEAVAKIGEQIEFCDFFNLDMFGYYHFNVKNGRFGFEIVAVKFVEMFSWLRNDVLKFALAEYFCELIFFFLLQRKILSNF